MLPEERLLMGIFRPSQTINRLCCDGVGAVLGKFGDIFE
jgi:hypothetical protein